MSYIRDVPQKWVSAYGESIGWLTWLFRTLNLPEYIDLINQETGLKAEEFRATFAEMVSMVESTYAAMGVPPPEERLGEITLKRGAAETTRNIAAINEVMTAVFTAMNKGDITRWHPFDRRALEHWATVFRPQFEQAIGEIAVPSVSYTEITGSLYDIYPHLSFDPKPSIDQLELGVSSLEGSLESGEIDGKPWYADLWSRIFDSDLLQKVVNLELLWDKLIGAVKTLATYHSRIWYAIGYSVIDALWEDEDADTEV